MIKKFCFTIINLFIQFIKKLKLDIYAFDKIIFCLGDVNISNNRIKYNEISKLSDVEVKVFSQNGEDGILDYLLNKLKVDSKNFIEIGVGNYRESNTRFLYQKYHPKGLIIDYIDDMEKKVKPFLNFWKGDLTICKKKIDSKNILDVINKNCNFEIDVFSLDIDSIDYWIIDELKPNISKIFIAEYNHVFGSELEVTVPNISGFERNSYHYSNLCYGMSLKALIKLMEKKDYYFIGSNVQKNNAFFISNDFKKEKFFNNIEIKSLDNYTNSNIRESLNKDSSLSYLSGDKKLKEIEECKVINLKDNKKDLVKIKELLN